LDVKDEFYPSSLFFSRRFSGVQRPKLIPAVISTGSDPSPPQSRNANTISFLSFSRETLPFQRGGGNSLFSPFFFFPLMNQRIPRTFFVPVFEDERGRLFCATRSLPFPCPDEWGRSSLSLKADPLRSKTCCFS